MMLLSMSIACEIIIILKRINPVQRYVTIAETTKQLQIHGYLFTFVFLSDVFPRRLRMSMAFW